MVGSTRHLPVGRLFGIAFAVCVAASLSLAPSFALADEESDLTAQKDANSTQIADQQARATELSNESADLQSQMQALQSESTDTANRLEQAQNHVSDLISYQYKTSADSNILNALVTSASWDDLVSRVTYYSKVTDSLSDAVEEVKSEQSELDSQKQKLSDLYVANQQNQEEATQLVSSLTSENADIDSRLSEIAAEKAAQEAAQQAAAQAAAQADAEAAGQSGSTSGSSGTDEGVEPDSSWSTGLASAYGPDEGSTATATGIPLDWTTKTVAIPMRWDNFMSYYWRYVQISYGGVTITAQVTDCGGLPGRALDLSPACQQAFGASSSSDWGVRTVSYRFL